ncbi:hypothetical protein JJL45_11450 [Tamlana sp. s12]|uniref:hypothetical protein n=1 Tax=Tamlana sp. s12 TaxID=1630406 RepID=UPI0007FEA674|nr:hypothetical protein [Tamlana sp. s12]OBQ51776.1 hypothetical protein VQ01_14970 [Tamlana sp. s12]QQY81539.1 hypothetical protein JJL45_11450 [Tamlana sp. s12]
MKPSIFKLLTLATIFILSGCSSVQEVNHWTSGNVASIKSKNVLVIVKVKKPKLRAAYEDQITKQLKAENIQATSSYKQYPDINPNDSISKEAVSKFKEKLEKDGFNGVVYSRVIGVEEISKTTTSGGYEAGTILSDYSNLFDMGFYGFYSYPLPSPSFEGVYEPVEVDTQTAKVYVLETVVYNLDLPQKDQLVASVTSKIDNLETGHNLAKNYAKTIINGVKKK